MGEELAVRNGTQAAHSHPLVHTWACNQTCRPQGDAKADSVGSSWPEVQVLCERASIHPDAQVRLAKLRLKQLVVGSVSLLACSSGTNLGLDKKISVGKSCVTGADFIIMMCTLYIM